MSGVLFVTNFFYRVYDSTTTNVLSESKEKTGGVIDYGIGIKKEAIKMDTSREVPEDDSRTD